MTHPKQSWPVISILLIAVAIIAILIINHFQARGRERK